MALTETRILPGLGSALQAEVVAKAFWALGHPIRLRIIQTLIEEGERTVTQLTERLPVSQPQVSVHLRCLVECGFTTVRKEGRHSYHRVSSPWTAGLLSLIRDHAESHLAGLLECVECAPRDLPKELRKDADASPTPG